MTPAGSSEPAAQSQTSSFDTQLALRLVWLAVLDHLLRSRRFHERVAVGAVVLAALARMGRESRASTFARLAAWNKREVERLERKAKRHGRAVQGAGQMMRSGSPKDLARTMRET
jgi:hypothetical protein